MKIQNWEFHSRFSQGQPGPLPTRIEVINPQPCQPLQGGVWDDRPQRTEHSCRLKVEGFFTTKGTPQKMGIYWVVPPPRMPVTTRMITFLVGDPYKPSFATVTGRGEQPKVYNLMSPLKVATGCSGRGLQPSTVADQVVERCFLSCPSRAWLVLKFCFLLHVILPLCAARLFSWSIAHWWNRKILVLRRFWHAIRLIHLWYITVSQPQL